MTVMYSRKTVLHQSIFFLTVAFVVLDCSGAHDKEIKSIKETIIRYDALLSQGYAEMDMTPLQEVATKDQALKAYRHMSAIGDAKKKMTSSLLDIQFLDLQLVQENVARVETRETWEYTHTPVGSQSPEPLHVQAVVYKLSYRLGKNNNNWYVASVEVLAEEKNDKDLERKQIVTKGSQPATKRE